MVIVLLWLVRRWSVAGLAARLIGSQLHLTPVVSLERLPFNGPALAVIVLAEKLSEAAPRRASSHRNAGAIVGGCIVLRS